MVNLQTICEVEYFHVIKTNSHGQSKEIDGRVKKYFSFSISKRSSSGDNKAIFFDRKVYYSKLN